VQLTEFYAALSELAMFEKRQVDENLIDIVFESKDTQVWNERLESVLGPALKPAGAAAGGAARKIANDFGGTRAEQTHYYKVFSDCGLVAMFWPWQNGRCTTCKAFHVAKLAETKPPFWAGWFGKK